MKFKKSIDMKKVLLVLTVALFTVSFAMGQTTYKGFVKSKDGKDAIAMAELKGLDAKGEVTASIQTDAKGKFKITLPPATTKIEVRANGFTPRTLVLGKKKKLKIYMLKQ